MKKIFLLILVLLCVIFFVAPASAADSANAPDGFRGIKFGSDLSKISGMKKMNVNILDMEAWTKVGDKLFIGDVPCSMILYNTYNNKFFQVTISFDTNDLQAKIDFLTIGKILIDKYGVPDQNLGDPENSDFHFAWQFENNVTVQFAYTEEPANNPTSLIIYTYMPILGQWGTVNSAKMEKQKEEERKESIKNDL